MDNCDSNVFTRECCFPTFPKREDNPSFTVHAAWAKKTAEMNPNPGQ